MNRVPGSLYSSVSSRAAVQICACVVATALLTLFAVCAAPVMPLRTAHAAEEADTGAAPPPDPGLGRLWIIPAESEGTEDMRLHLRYAESYRPGETMHLEGEVQSQSSMREATLRLTVTDAKGEPLAASGLTLSLRPGGNPFAFACPAWLLEPGDYAATFTLQGPGGRTLATNRLRIMHLTHGSVAGAASQLETRIDRMYELLLQRQEAGQPVTESRMQLALVEYASELAREALDKGGWHTAHRQVGFAHRTLDAIGARMVFLAPASAGMPARGDLAPLRVDHGTQRQGGAPVLPFGFAGIRDFDRYARLVKHLPSPFITLSVPPSALASEDGRRELTATLDAAGREGVRVMAVLQPERLAGHGGLLTAPLLLGPERAVLENYLRDALALLGSHPAVMSVALSRDPRFDLDGPVFREEFRTFAQGIYRNLDELNRTWRVRLRDYSEVFVNWEFNRAAYQYDVQQFHIDMGTRMLTGLRSFTAALGTPAPVHVVLSSEVFSPGYSRHGVDTDAVARLFDWTAVETPQPRPHPVFALGIRDHSMVYSLMHSLTPDRPVLNARLGLAALLPEPGAEPYRPIQAALWLGLVSGMQGAAAIVDESAAPPDGGSLADRPDAIEAFLMTAADANRIAPIVHAFQRARAEIGILWSPPSTIFENGEEYLTSLEYAYDGSLFGGRKTRFVSERQCWEGALTDLGILIVPRTLAVANQTFAAIEEYVVNGGVIIRPGSPIPYDEQGKSRQDVLSYTDHTILVLGDDAPTRYLHGLDAAYALGRLRPIPRTINAHGYPLEGVVSRHVLHNGGRFLFILNLRKTPAQIFLTSGHARGYDHLGQREVQFPMVLQPLEVRIVQLMDEDAEGVPRDLASIGPQGPPETVADSGVPSAVLEPVRPAPRR